MDTTAVAASIWGALIGAQLMRVAGRQARRARLKRISIVLTELAVLTELVTNGGGHSRTSHAVVFYIACSLVVSAIAMGVLGRRAVLADTGSSRADHPG
jgi:hypothetical protein